MGDVGFIQDNNAIDPQPDLEGKCSCGHFTSAHNEYGCPCGCEISRRILEDFDEKDDEIYALCAERNALKNKAILDRAEIDSLGSELLLLQQDCIGLRTTLIAVTKELRALRQDIIDRNDPTPLQVFGIANELIKLLEKVVI